MSGWRTRWRRPALVAVLLGLLPGCGLPVGGTLDDSPDPLPPDRLVFVLDRGSNGFSSRLSGVVDGPDLLVYGDGRVVVPAAGQNPPEQPTAYVVTRVDPTTVARFAADADERGVIREGTDFGDAIVTDQATTTVALEAYAGRHLVSVYAMEDRFEGGLTRAQRRARAELREVIGAATRLAEQGPTSPYDPDRVRVVELEAVADGAGAGVPWPGPDPATFLEPSSGPGELGCGTLSGADARRVYAAARGNPDGRWAVGRDTRLLAVAVILPGRPACRA